MAPHQPRAERVSLDAFVIARSPSGEEWVFRTRDLSSTGLFLYTRVARAYPLKVGSTLELDVHDEAASFRCTAVVARVVEPGSAEADTYPTGFGLHFVTITGDARTSLDTMRGGR
jgi:hypothetical protein